MLRLLSFSFFFCRYPSSEFTNVTTLVRCRSFDVHVRNTANLSCLLDMSQTASGFTVVIIPHDFRRIGLEQMVVGFHREQWREVGNIGESWVITRQRWRIHTAENQPAAGDQGGEGKKPLRGRLFAWPLDMRYPWSGSVVLLSQAWKTQQEP